MNGRQSYIYRQMKETMNALRLKYNSNYDTEI